MKRLALAVTLGLAGSANAQEIEHHLSFPSAANHYVDVEASFPAAGRESVEIMMAVWTPGSYLVREYARHIEGLEVTTPKGAAVVKTRKNRWRVGTNGADRVAVRYRLYGREMSVRTNWVESEFAILNGAPTFLTLLGAHDVPHAVRLSLPDDWRGSWTALPAHPDGGPNHYRASDFDTLVDSPIYAGSPAVHEIEVAGKAHVLVNHGERDIWDGPRSAADVKRIVEEAYAFWGQLPYDRYVFLNMITEAGGGLEHKDSTLMMTSRWRPRVPEDYRRWLGLVSHEYFHAWNVKRLRPKALGPFDYENEVYTKSLWVAEGVTSYYDDLLLVRAGLYTETQYLEALSGQIERLQTTPGRTVRPLEDASYDAWIKQYRRDENSPNATISYYTKGAVVAFLLDAEIRRATNGEKSLDDMMRMAYELYSGDTGYTPAEFRAIASEIAGTDLSGWFESALETTDELDYSSALDWFGLTFEGKNKEDADGEAPAPEERTAWLGVVTRRSGGRLLVGRVERGTPAYEIGLNVGDEILAIGDYRVPPSEWADRMRRYRPGDDVELLIARRDRLQRLPVVFGEKPETTWKLRVDPSATDDARKRRAAWLTR